MSDTLIFEERLISEKDIGSAIFRIYENHIYHVTIKKGEKVTLDIIRESYAFSDENGGGQYYNIFEFHSFSDIDPEVREWAASPTGNNYTIADAVVISSFPQKIIADFYMRYNKPVKPTKVFNSMEKAYEWVREIRLKNDLKFHM